MKVLLYVASLLLIATPTHATDPVPKNATCSPTKDLVKHFVNDLDASPTSAGMVDVNGIQQLLSLWQKPDGGFAVVITNRSGESCVLVEGTEIHTQKWHSLDPRHNV